MLPKVHSVEDLESVTDAMEAFGRSQGTIHLVASIESARALHNIGGIAAWKSVYGPEKGGELKALLVRLPSPTIHIHQSIHLRLVCGGGLYDAFPPFSFEE